MTNAATQLNEEDAPQTRLAPSRCAIFFDVPNLYGTAKHEYDGRKPDLIKLRKQLVDGRTLVTSNAYFATPPKVRIDTVRAILEREGMKVFHKEMTFAKAAGALVGGWTAQMASDITAAARDADTIIMVTGRGDFSDLAASLRANGVRVEVCAFESSLSENLRGAADAVIPITTEHLR